MQLDSMMEAIEVLARERGVEVDAILEKRRWLLARETGAELGCPPAGAAS